MRRYQEIGTTTTPFDMVVRNDLDRYRLVMDVIDRVPGLSVRAAAVRQHMEDARQRHHVWIREHGMGRVTGACGPQNESTTTRAPFGRRWPDRWTIAMERYAEMSQSVTEVRHHPAVVAHHSRRAEDIQLRVADAITKFAGSMTFVYIHAIVFAAWMLFFESSPWPTLTLVVSLEAIFLSTFVMIGQNRQAAFQQIKADHDFIEQELELKTNTELTRAIHAMTMELHRRLIDDGRAREVSGPAERQPS